MEMGDSYWSLYCSGCWQVELEMRVNTMEIM